MILFIQDSYIYIHIYAVKETKQANQLSEQCIMLEQNEINMIIRWQETEIMGHIIMLIALAVFIHWVNVIIRII